MYTKYTYTASTTQANLLNDLVLLLTGTTDKTTLSANCDQANTSILTTYSAAGWELYDAAAGTNAKVIRAACDGDAAQFKYVEINTNTAGQIYLGVWESWNAGTHVGTNLAFQSKTTGYGARYSTTVTGDVHISASSGRIVIWTTSAAGNGVLNGNGAFLAVLECDRAFTWCAVGQGYTPVVWIAGSNATMPRHKDFEGISRPASNSALVIYTIGVGLTGSPMGAVSGIGIPMASGFITPVGPFLAYSNSAAAGTAVSGFAASGLFMNCGAWGNTLDELLYDSKTWVMFPCTNASSGYNKLMVPKG